MSKRDGGEQKSKTASSKQTLYQSQSQSSQQQNPYENYGYGARAAHIQSPYGQAPQYPHYTLDQQQQAYAAQMNAYNNAAYYYPPTIPQYYPSPPVIANSEPEPPAKRGRTNTYSSAREMPYTPQPNAFPPSTARKHQQQSRNKPARAVIPERPNFPSNNQDQEHHHNSNKRSHNAMNAGSNNNLNNRSSKRQAQGISKAGKSMHSSNQQKFKAQNKQPTSINSDDKRRTLTDFRIIAIKIPVIDWEWNQGESVNQEDKDSSKEMARLRLYFASPPSLEKKRGTPQTKTKESEMPMVKPDVDQSLDPFDNKIKEIEETIDKQGILEPSSNRISLSYDHNTRRLLLDAELIEDVIIKRKEAKILIKMRLQRTIDPLSKLVEETKYVPEIERDNIINSHKSQIEADNADNWRICPGILLEIYDNEQESYIPLKRNFDDNNDDKSIPPFQKLVAQSSRETVDQEGLPQLTNETMLIECSLETNQPLTEARWVRNGNVEEWIEQTVSGAAFNAYKNYIAKQQNMSARVGWHGKIKVLDPDPPPTMVSRMNNWAKTSSTFSFKERQKFLVWWFGIDENLIVQLEPKDKGTKNNDEHEEEVDKGDKCVDKASEENDKHNDADDIDNDKNSVTGEINDIVKELEVLAREQDDDDNIDIQLSQSRMTTSTMVTAEEYDGSQAGLDAAIEILTRFIPFPIASESVKVILKNNASTNKDDVIQQVRKLPQNLINRSLDFAFKDYIRLVGRPKRY
ncbi:hypothetical protein E3Q18_03395 [Wallemia mellicola]|uniref:Uncharacterized protein n=1 Tax=Wallemia mellicola TaxID=1708541 RepID=A0A4T0QV02_9BASI|nr:hypothetical protein E3Q23_03235 [Wallemia mellicola]TIB88633.1 hypothetical protein E3Q19_03284 [Wallemia mellicola]TIB96025.1 hypothetical protein E3Q18_03395 [Wallemia mellicola]TIC09753.1 hypothetical protein E3Q15_03369 [Wallemia mellicola]TIC28351.1 hypothetical protein E3Q10_03234 [Wallemia mellicola]